jgi:ABC-type multidrug transport system fused ATPase/permease subunit
VRLLGFLRPYRGSLVVSSLLAIGSQIAGILVPVLTGVVINEVSGEPDTTTIALWIALIIALGVVRAAFMVGRRLISGRQALGVEYDLRDDLYSQFLRLSFGFFDRSQVGQLMSRATIDLQSVRFFLGYGLIFFAQHIVTVVVVSVVLFFYSWELALVAVAITPAIILIAYRYSHVSHPVLRDVQQKLAEVAIVAEESIVGVHVVKAFAQEEHREEQFTAAADSVFHQTLAANRQRALYVPLLSFMPLLAQAAVLLVAGRMVVSGSLSLGDFFAFNLLLAMLVMPLRMLGMWIGQAQRAIAAGERIFEILDEPEEIADRPHADSLPAGPGAVRFEAVDFAYEPGRLVLEGIDFELEPGRTIALIGRTGSGKTTLASLLPRFYDATSGRVLIDGVDVREVQRRSLRREIGVISQDPFLFSTSVRDNIAFGMPDAPHDAVEAAARAAQAHEFIEELPQGYDTVVGERGMTLSGGQRQRIAIARALLIDPRILILDDATASVDATTESRIRAGLQEVMRERTTIIIAHRLSTIALADEILVLDHGRIAARGTQAELLLESPLFREIHEHGLLQQVVAG